MEYPVPEQIPNRKAAILDLLQILACEERQLAYERDASHVNITEELIVMWFNDQYHPDDAYFASCFTQDELTDLAEFNQYFDDRRRQLLDSHGTIRTWLSCPVWREIIQKAQRTLERITK